MTISRMVFSLYSTFRRAERKFYKGLSRRHRLLQSQRRTDLGGVMIMTSPTFARSPSYPRPMKSNARNLHSFFALWSSKLSPKTPGLRPIFRTNSVFSGKT